jgi:hypothetical protein
MKMNVVGVQTTTYETNSSGIHDRGDEGNEQ